MLSRRAFLARFGVFLGLAALPALPALEPQPAEPEPEGSPSAFAEWIQQTGPYYFRSARDVIEDARLTQYRTLRMLMLGVI